MRRFGSYTLHTIETGRFRLDGGAMFGIIPKPLWAGRIEPDERNRILMHMRCLLLEGNDRLVLIDAGMGHKYDAKFADIYGVDHDAFTLDRSLHAAGFSPADVTDVILTHLHFDHGGGVTENRNGELAIAFPAATIHVQRRHWEWAQRPNARERGSFLRPNLEPLAASGQMHLLDGSAEILPGVHVFTVEGHTEAQQLVRIDGGGRSLLYAADLLPTHLHLPSVWVMAYDLRPLVTMEEKERILREAAQNGWSLFFEHDAAVEVADVTEGERGFEAAHPRVLDEA
jgi:glyoxylase-like metal-dependent hydrolase (beta-lactamase superfamily II)